MRRCTLQGFVSLLGLGLCCGGVDLDVPNVIVLLVHQGGEVTRRLCDLGHLAVNKRRTFFAFPDQLFIERVSGRESCFVGAREQVLLLAMSARWPRFGGLRRKGVRFHLMIYCCDGRDELVSL
jgi:hypothetical protein